MVHILTHILSKLLEALEAGSVHNLIDRYRLTGQSNEDQAAIRILSPESS